MKNKFKALLAAFVGLFAFSAVAVGVNAETLTYGTVAISTTSYAGDTKTWDFTTNLPSSNTSIAVGSDINGIVSAKEGTGNKAIQIKSSAKNGYDTYPGAEFLVPVPSATSAGVVTRTGNSDNTRFLALGSNTAVALAKTMNFNFTSTDVETNPTLSDDSTVTGYYLRFIVSGGEAKNFSIAVKLTDGSSYGVADVKYTVTYMDGESTLNTEEIVKDNKVSYAPKKYGYDFEGWYLDSALTNKVDTATYTVTDNVTLYANWTAWTTTGIEEYTLTSAAIAKIATGIDGKLTADLALTPSIYTYMKNGEMTTTNVTLPGATEATQSPCFNTGGAVSTTGNGLKFTAPEDGFFTACIGTGGTGKERSAMLLTAESATSLIPIQGAGALSFDGTVYTPVELTWNVTKGTTYYLGGSNGMRIYYAQFTQINLQYQVNEAYTNSKGEDVAAGSQIRFVGTVNCLTADTLASATATLKLTLGNQAKDVEITTVYSSVAVSGNLTYAAAEGVYYVVFIISGLDDASLDGVVLTAQLDVTVGGTTYSSVVKSHTIA